MTRNPKPKDFRHEVRRRAYMAASTIEDAATAIGVTRQTLQEWMVKGDLRISQLAALARASKKPLALYFDADDEKQPVPIEWDRLSEWLSSITAMVEAVTPEEARERKARELADEPEQSPPSPMPDGSSAGRSR